MTHEEYTKIDIDKAYKFIQTGAWNKEMFAEWYSANVSEAQSEAVYYSNL